MPATLRLRDEITGGLVSAAVAIPLAMAFGMFAFTSLGDSYFATGALAGLTTAIVVALVSLIASPTSILVFAPRVTSTFFLGLLLYGLVHSEDPKAIAGGAPLYLVVMFSTILLGGLFEALFGLFRIGTIIRFIPQPVMAGFQNAAAALLFLVQLGNVCGFDRTTPFTQVVAHLDQVKPLSVLVGVATFAVMWKARSLLPKIPPLMVGMTFGCLLFYGLSLAGLRAHLGPVITQDHSSWLGTTIFPFHELVLLGNKGLILHFLPLVVVGALALAIIASIDALLCAKLIKAPNESRIDGNGLLVRLGIGNMAAAAVGGITSGLNIGASITNRNFGGRTRLSVLINALALVVAGTIVFPWLGLIPRVVLSALIMVVAVQHFDVWSLRLLGQVFKGPAERRWHILLDLAVVVLVAILSIVLDIVLAVFIGLALAVVLFVLRMSRSVIRRTYFGDVIHSRKSRTMAESAFLEKAGRQILVIELQGALFFGTGEKLLNDVDVLTRLDASWVILDLRRLSDIDSTGAQILEDMKLDLARRGLKLCLATGDGKASAFPLPDMTPANGSGPELCFSDVDRAIEFAEDELLRASGTSLAVSGELSLEQVSLFQGFGPRDMAELARRLRRVAFSAGEMIFRQGEPGDELLIVMKGEASAYLRLPSGADIRLATFPAGTAFGELAILDQGLRSASVKADDELVCYAISKADFARLSQEEPAIAVHLLSAIGRELSSRLRAANRAIQQLEAS